MINVTVWNEFFHEQNEENVKKIYPNGIHGAIKDFLQCEDISVTTSTFYDEEFGLSEELLKKTDVLIWWSHKKNRDLPDEIASRVQNFVLCGMGIIFLHSAHFSKPFKLLMGTSCTLSWREDGDSERIWVATPSHPIAKGLAKYFDIKSDETYCEPFGIPNPDETVFLGWYDGGEVFRSGCTFYRENGRIFYFQPGHETYPVFYDKNVQTIIKNAVFWANPVRKVDSIPCPKVEKKIPFEN